jgi:Na+-transporting methylmalonyl-CoA/oxaloacetate decarboxylase gamma subunit
MNHSFIALALQDAADSSTWIIIGVVLVLLFLFVLVVAIGLVIFFVMRKKKKAQQAGALVPEVSSRAVADAPLPSYSEEPAPDLSEAAVAVDIPPPVYEAPPPMEEIRSDVAEAYAPPPAEPYAPPAVDSGSLDFDPSRTVAITRENTVTIDYGRIKFVSGVLAGQEFEVQPEGSYIGREASLSQIVVSDPRISKRHLWIGVKDALVKIVDQESRNGTFINDPRSERITEAALNNGDTVILGESDVARFEYQV